LPQGAAGKYHGAAARLRERMRLLTHFPKQAVVAILLVASAALYLLGPGVAGRLRGLAEVVLVPLGDPGMGVTAAFNSRWGGVRINGGEVVSPERIRNLIRQNQVLRSQLEALDAKYRALEQQRRELDELYDRWSGFECALIPARVVADEPLPFGSSRILNKGARSGVHPGAAVTTRRLLTDRSKALPPGLAVVTSTALVGRIVTSGAFTSRVQLVTDRGFRMHARVRRIVDEAHPRKVMRKDRTSLVTLTEQLAAAELIDVELRGDGAGGLIAEDVDEGHKIRPGDWLVTVREDPLLQIQIRIGTIRDVQLEPSNPHFVTLRGEPFMDLDALRSVYIVVPLADRAAALEARR